MAKDNNTTHSGTSFEDASPPASAWGILSFFSMLFYKVKNKFQAPVSSESAEDVDTTPASDEQLDEGEEPAPTNGQSRQCHTAPPPVEDDLRPDIYDFFERWGHCPLCGWHEVGFLPWGPTSGGTRIRLGGSRVGIPETESDMKAHLEDSHPREMQLLRQGIPVPIRSDTSVPQCTDADLDELGRVMDNIEAEVEARVVTTTHGEYTEEDMVPTTLYGDFTEEEMDMAWDIQDEFEDWFYARGGL